jgi:hypothetical protein
MGYLESAVVVYLRELYFPSGFSFPAVSLSGSIAVIEVYREIATIIMLLSVGFLAGKNIRQKAAWFIYCFAVWDIFYYVFLKITLNWPESFFTWDLLFLIPTIWTGPVISPVVVSITMIILAGMILYGEVSTTGKKISGITVFLSITGSILIFGSFIWSFSVYMIRTASVSAVFNPGQIQIALREYVPYDFNWYLFIAGEIVLLAGICFQYLSYRKAYKHQ